MQVQSCASFPSEVCIVPSKNASSWEDDAPVDGSDGIEVVNETTTTILFNVNEDDEIYSVQVDPSPKAIKAFTKSDSTITTKKKAERTVKVSSSEDEEESASVTVQSKRKADTVKVGENVAKRTKVATQKQSEKAIIVADAVESPKNVEKEAPKKTRSRSRSASIAEEPASNVAAGSKKLRKDSNASEEPKSSKKKKTKKVKDPNAPKRPLTSFMLFCKDAREDIKKEHPDAAVPEMGKLLGAKYKELSEAEKEVYGSQSAALKMQFDLDKVGYLKSKVDIEALISRCQAYDGDKELRCSQRRRLDNGSSVTVRIHKYITLQRSQILEWYSQHFRSVGGIKEKGVLYCPNTYVSSMNIY